MNNINKYILFIAYFIVAPEFINGKGTNYHIFIDQVSTSICRHEVTLKEGEELEKVGQKSKSKAELKAQISKYGEELCANCSGDSIHTDRKIINKI